MVESYEANKVISQHRKNEIVITTFSTSYEWSQVSTKTDLDLPLSGMAMGKASSVGLGLALAQPSRKIILMDSDGSLLMNLGSLVTIANMAPRNLIHFVFENSVYRTSGGQPIPNASKLSFSGLAASAGYANVYEFAELSVLEDNIATILDQTGPVFVCIKVPPSTNRLPFPSVEINDVLSRFKKAIEEI